METRALISTQRDDNRSCSVPQFRPSKPRSLNQCKQARLPLGVVMAYLSLGFSFLVFISSIIFHPLFSLMTSFVLPILGKSFTWPCKSSHRKPFSEWKLEASFRILHLCRTEFIFTGFLNLYYRKKHNLSSSEWYI